jgi:ATP-dependent DNA helicase RecG
MDITILSLTERVRNTIALGESHFREFKSALSGPPSDKRPRPAKDVCRDIAEALVSFANADGGELLVGVEDDGSISGVPQEKDDLILMLNAFNSHVHPESKLPLTHNQELRLDGKIILFFAVSKGTTRIYQLSDGRCVRRRDKITAPADVHDLLFARQEAESRAYDQEFVDGATVSALDATIIQSIADSFFRGMSVEHYLQQVGLAEYAPGGLRLRRAALLLFAKEISRWHPRSNVRIMKVLGNEVRSGDKYNVAADETAQGNVFQLLQGAWEKLRLLLAYKTDFGEDARFEQRYLYPEWACREALVNAIAHRAYNNARGIEIFVFDDRMEIRSPGSLLSTLTVESLRKLTGAHESRNTLISRVLRENKVMRELGEGIKRIFKLMEENELLEPKIANDETWFTMSLPHKSVFSPQQEEWLKLFLVHKLSGLQKRVVVLGMGGREISRQDIVKSLSTKDRDVYDLTVTPLRHQGILAQVRTAAAAASMAQRKGINRDAIGRWKVVAPSSMREPLTISCGRTDNLLHLLEASNIVPSQRSIRAEQPFCEVKPQIVSKTQEKCSVFFHFKTSAIQLTKEEVVKHFSSCGRIKDVSLPRIPNSDVQKGYGFVVFDSAESVFDAVKQLNGSFIGDRKIGVEPTRSSGKGGNP